MKKNKYEFISYENISDKYLNSIGFITPTGDLIRIRKYRKSGFHHMEVADKILELLNDKCENFYGSCERLLDKYGYLLIIDDYGDNKVSICFYNDPTERQINSIIRLYKDYEYICEKEDNIKILSL